MKITLQIYNYWDCLEEDFEILAFHYGNIMNYNVVKGYVFQIMILNFALDINFWR